MAIIKSEIQTDVIIDSNGKETSTTVEKTVKIEHSNEPDYIKLYTNMWCEFNEIPNQWRLLFFELVTRMTYANSSDPKNSQIVATGGMIRDAICKSLGWKQNMYQKGLKALKDVGAIKQRSKGFYQVNPSYAGKGEWKYNPRLKRGGVEDLIATFNFKDKTVESEIIWADDGASTNTNKFFREMLNTSPEKHDSAIFKSEVITNETNKREASTTAI